MPLRYLVLLDIDGTLLWPDGAGRAAMVAALERVYGTAGPIDSYYLGGRTDLEAVHDLMRAAGLPPEVIEARYSAFAAAFSEELRRRLALGLHHIRPCPGGPELVGALLARPDTLTGLLTGNLKPTAALKLEAAGYSPADFRVAAFGGEAAERALLFKLAVERAARLAGCDFPGQQVVVIGDTPADVQCGQPYGARAIAVLTGSHPRAELEAAGADFIFDDLADTQAVLEAIFAPPTSFDTRYKSPYDNC